MIIYLYLFIPPLFLSVESSSIRGRNNKNELVPLMSSGVDTLEKENNLKVVSNEPFIIQLHVPKHNDSKSTREKDKKRKRPGKKRTSKLRKKHRTRRDLRASRLIKRTREEKSQPTEIPIPANATEVQVKNTTKNSINRVEILKALSSYSRKKQNKTIEEREDDAEDTKRTHPFSDKSPIVKMIYPSTPKLDRHSHKYTYKDLMADRKRLEQKINYIKNMFSANDSATDDAVRIRRRTETDKTANKIAKMFLTLSAVNGLRDRRKARCKDNDEDDGDRVQDVWDKEQQSSPNRKAYSSNAERYKVKKWVEFMKNTRSSGKTCPCMASMQGDDSDAFPLEQKLPKDYFLMERSRSSEESSETYRDPYYHSRDRPNRRKYGKDAPDNKLKALGKNAKKKLDLPLNDLELYRSRAKQILQNAEEILDKIKEEEERRLSAPSILMSQLKELTSRIQSDPRNNENDLIRKMQKTLGWKPLAKGKEGSDVNTFIDNVKSYILDPYEKAKALTDESAKTLSSYLLRNLGKMQDSSEELEAKQSDDETNPLVFFGQVPTKEEEKPLAASLAKEDSQPDLLSKTKEELQNWEDTISTIMQGPEEAVQKVPYNTAGDVIKNRMEDIIKEQQKKLDDYEASPRSEENREADGDDNGHTNDKKTKPGIKFTKPEKHTLGGYKHPLRLKPKDGNDKDKTDKLKNTPGSHLKGISKVPLPKAPKPDTSGGDKHLFRLKPKEGSVHEHGKPVKEMGNHQKHPIHLKVHPKGRKIPLAKASGGSTEENEDPETTASKETEELGKEILEEIVKTLENDKNTDSPGENREITDPQVREMVDTVQWEENNEDEVGNPNETPLQVTLGGENSEDESAVPGEQQRSDENLQETVSGKTKMPIGRQDLPDRPHQSLPEDGSQSYGKAPSVDSSASHYPSDYDLLPGDEDETPGKLSDSLRGAVGEALEDLSGLTNEESLVQKPETVIYAKVPEDKSLEEVIDPLLRKAEQLETELIKKESDLESRTNEDSLQGVINPLLKKAEQPKTELTGKKSDLENASAEDNLEDAIDPLLKMAQQLETELDGKEGRIQNDPETQRKDSVQEVNQEFLENPESTANGNKHESGSNEKDERDPLNVKFERQNAKNRRPVEQEVEATLNQEDDEESSEEVGKSESEEDDGGPVIASLKTQESSEERPDEKLRAVLEEENPEMDEYAPLKAAKFEGQGNDSMEDSDETPLKEALEKVDDDDGESSLRETQENKEDEDDDSSLKKDDSPVGKTLGRKEDKENDEESRLRKALNKEKEEKYDNPLRKSLGSNDKSEEIPLRKTLESKEDEDDDVSSPSKETEKQDTPLRSTMGNKDENPLRKALKEQEDKYDTPLRKTLEKEEQKGNEFPLRKSLGQKEDEHDDDDGTEIPLRKTLGSKEDEDDSPLRKALEKQGHPLKMRPVNAEDKEDEIPLKKTLQREDDVDDEETPLRKTMENGEKSDAFVDNEDDGEPPLRKTMKNKEDEDDDDDDDKTPLRKTMENEEDGDDETPLRKTMKNEEGGDSSADDDDDTLRKSMSKKDDGDTSADDNGDETPLRKTLKSEDDEGDGDDSDEITPLGKTMNTKDQKDDDTSGDDDDSPLRKTMKSRDDEDEGDDDETPLKKSMKNREGGGVSAEDDEETPLRKTMKNYEDGDVYSDDNGSKTPLRKTMKNTKDRGDETPLRKSMKNKEGGDVSAEDDEETPLRKTMQNDEDGDVYSDDNGSKTPLRKTMKNTEDRGDDDDEETPLRKTMKNEDENADASADAEDESPLRKTMKNQEDGNVSDDDDDETPLRKTIKNKEDRSDEDDKEDPLRNAMKTKDSDDSSTNDDEDDETPLKNAMKTKESGDNSANDDEDDETPLRNALENEKYEDDASDDDTPLREALENQREKDETSREETATEETDNLRSSKPKAEDIRDQSIAKEPNTQTEEISTSEEETPLREMMKQRNENPESYRTVNSEENQSEQNELQEDRDETPLQATPNEQNELEAENYRFLIPLQGGNNDRQSSEEFKDVTAQDEENLKSADPTKGEQQQDNEGDETSEEVALNRKDAIDPEVDTESLLKSAEDPENLIDGANSRAENPDEATSEEMPLRSSLNDESFEDAQEKTNEEPSLRAEKPESQSEETSQEKSGEALRLAFENLAEDMEKDDEPSLKAARPIDQETTDDPQNEDGSIETVKANLSNEASEEGDGETVKEAATGRTLEGSNQEHLEDTNPIKTGTSLDPEERSRSDEQFDVTQNSEEAPLRLSLDQQDPDENRSDEDTENPLRNASQENELDSNMQETPLQSAKTIDEIQEESNSEETVRAEDTHNQIDGTEDETPLRSANFEESNDSTENSLETLREGNPLGEDDNAEGSDSQETLPDLLQMGEKPSKTGKLKLPKSIGQIIKDLNGRAKDDITTLQNLNPDKIDDMIGKIGEAEQQNLLEHPDVDCRKECACAEEIDTRSRNIGRYEIVKDFLHWMKDLQLNRVLTDD